MASSATVLTYSDATIRASRWVGVGQLGDVGVLGEPRAAVPGHPGDRAVQHPHWIAAGLEVHPVGHRPVVLAGRLELRQGGLTDLVIGGGHWRSSCGAKWGTIICRHGAASGLLQRSISLRLPGI